jgi:hypothetical protein
MVFFLQVFQLKLCMDLIYHPRKTYPQTISNSPCICPCISLYCNVYSANFCLKNYISILTYQIDKVKIESFCNAIFSTAISLQD